MGQLNLYKIDDYKVEYFFNELRKKYVSFDKIIKTREVRGLNIAYTLSLYTCTNDNEKNVEWQWLLNAFKQEKYTNRSNPKSILVLQGDKKTYACTFGFSYFTADKYCDTDFAFNFARKHKFIEVKTTALTAPTSKRNKTINTYINYSELEFNSGEAFSKIKAKLDIFKEFPLFEQHIELGHSIKFNLKKDDLDKVIDTILFVEDVIITKEDIYKIPVFDKITDKEYLDLLYSKLIKSAQEEELNIAFSEFDIIGTTEIFNNTDYYFVLKYKREELEINNISFQDFKNFALRCSLDLESAFENIKIISYYMGNSVKTDTLISVIDYIEEEERCVLSKGKWYRFNDDYLDYLKSSLYEIDIIYNPKYDFTTSIHDNFIDEKYYEFQHDDEYSQLSKDEAKKKLKRKFYAERVFNTIREQEDGFKNYDRVEQRYGKATIELMDLYKDETMFAVKIGKASSSLCYVVDQSLSSLKMYQHKTLEHMPTINNVAIWLILERGELPLLKNQKPDIDCLDMFLLKNKIDGWKKEVRLAGLKPIIYINYRAQ